MILAAATVTDILVKKKDQSLEAVWYFQQAGICNVLFNVRQSIDDDEVLNEETDTNTLTLFKVPCTSTIISVAGVTSSLVGVVVQVSLDLDSDSILCK